MTEVNFKPKKPLTVSVLKADGTPAKRSRPAGKGDFVRALIIDKNGNVLQSMEWSIECIAKQVERAKKKGADDVRIAYGLLNLGDDARNAAHEEIMAALRRHGVSP